MINAIKGGRGFEIAVPAGTQDSSSLQVEIAKLKAAAQTKYGASLTNFEFRLVTRDSKDYLQIKEQTWFGGFKESHNWGSSERTKQRDGAVDVLKRVYGDTVSNILDRSSKAPTKSIDQTSARALVHDIGIPLDKPAIETHNEPIRSPSGSIQEAPTAKAETFNPNAAFSELPTGDFVIALDAPVFKEPETVKLTDLPPIIVKEHQAEKGTTVPFDNIELPKGNIRRGSVVIEGSGKGDIPIKENKPSVVSAAILKAEQEAKQRLESNSYEAKIRLAAAGADSPQKALEKLEKRAELASYLEPDAVSDMAFHLVGPRQWGKEIASIALDALKGLDISNNDDEQISVFSDLLLQKAVHLVGESHDHHRAHDAIVNFKNKAEQFVILSDEGYAQSLKLRTLMDATGLTSTDVIDVFDHHDAYLAVEPGTDRRAELEVAIGRAFADNATDRDLQLIDQFFPRPTQA